MKHVNLSLGGLLVLAAAASEAVAFPGPPGPPPGGPPALGGLPGPPMGAWAACLVRRWAVCLVAAHQWAAWPACLARLGAA